VPVLLLSGVPVQKVNKIEFHNLISRPTFYGGGRPLLNN
jgi:hypothetical protein